MKVAMAVLHLSLRSLSGVKRRGENAHANVLICGKSGQKCCVSFDFFLKTFFEVTNKNFCVISNEKSFHCLYERQIVEKSCTKTFRASLE